MTVVFVAMFAVIFVSLAELTSLRYHEGALQAQDELAFQVAEAGLNYGRWRLAHDPENFTAEERDVTDQFAGTTGTFNVTFTAPQEGSSVVLITSLGSTSAQPGREYTLQARYGMPSLAKYAFITNDDVWYGGPMSGVVHSNGGIRMDGISDSLMTSAKETYVCKPYHGCNYETKPGVWGSGEKQELWEFPVPVVDYTALTLDLLDMKSEALEAGTYYGPSGNFGYHVVFNSNNTYSLSRVTQKTSPIWSWAQETGWEYTSHDINREQPIGSRQVPSGGILYFEDNVWVNGTIRGRITVAAGRFPDQPSTNADIIINGSIDYGGVEDGSRVFGAIAQRHILIPYSGAPNVLQLDGAYIAQKGRFGRRYYYYGAHRIKSTMNTFGMTGSNMVPVTAWVDGSGQVVSGYRGGQSSYDSHLIYGPPPFFPTTGQYEFLSWEHVE